MTLASGAKLGPYEILAPLGAGGMGEVYRAKDPRLGREVAIKVLPASFSQDPDRLRRFEAEARAAGVLNHPNITAVHDFGTHDGAPYIVTELLEGETLRVRLLSGSLPVRKAVDYAIQMAKGLAAAHEKGIVHRDLKPENLFLTKDGRVKILDFGLAKLMRPEGPSSPQTNLPTADGTEPGVVLGTLDYMAPEQVKGEPADARSDIFAFGSVLYEMLSGTRPFRRGTMAETMSAILNEEPPDVSASNTNVPPGLERVVRHCLEKNPEERFHSAHDLAFDLQALSGSAPVAAAASRVVAASRPRRWLLVGGAVLALTAAALLVGRGTVELEPPSFRQITFRRGTIYAARFAPDGQTVVYSAAWDGGPMEIFVSRPESPESRPFGLVRAEVLSVSRSGDMAVSLDRQVPGFRRLGTLAQVSVAGGAAPREILERVEWADWAPDGKTLAVSLAGAGKSRIEYPVGKTVYETSGWVSHVRVSPDGELVAFDDHPTPGDDGGSIAVVDRSGKKRLLSPAFSSAQGLAWGDDGRLWFTATAAGDRALYATTRSGKMSLRVRVPGSLTLQDISREGRMLVTRDALRLELVGMAPGDSKERDLTWLGWTVGAAITSDGRTILFSEMGEGGGAGYSVYVRKTDGSPAVRLGEGSAQDLSPDGKWALAIQRPTSDRRLVAYSTGAGETKVFETGGLRIFAAAWLADGNGILIGAAEPGRGPRVFRLDVTGGKPRALTPEGFSLDRVTSPDGKWTVVTGPDRRRHLFPLAGGDPAPISGLEDDDEIDQRSADGRFLYVRRRGEAPAKVYRLELATGKKELWRTLMPADAAGVPNVRPRPSADGQSYVYDHFRFLSDLYLVEGVK
jgi:Tol biopolymer transport system component